MTPTTDPFLRQITAALRALATAEQMVHEDHPSLEIAAELLSVRRRLRKAGRLLLRTHLTSVKSAQAYLSWTPTDWIRLKRVVDEWS